MSKITSEEFNMAREQASLIVASTSAGIGASNGVWSFLNENAGAISLGIGLASFIVTVIFAYLGYRVRAEANKINREREEHERIKRELDKKKSTLEIEKLKTEIEAAKKAAS